MTRARAGASEYGDPETERRLILAATARGMEAVGKVLGEAVLEESVFPGFRKRYAWLNEKGSSFYGRRVRFGLRQPKSPKELMESSYAVLSRYVSSSLGEGAEISVAFDSETAQWTYSGGSVGYWEHEPTREKGYFIELRLRLGCGGEWALKNAACVMEDAGAEVGKKYDWDDEKPWKFYRQK